MDRKEPKNNRFHDRIIYKDIKNMLDMLVPLVSSYRLLVGAADEFNRIALVSKHDAEEAIDRADDLGHIIDNLQDELNKAIKLYIEELDNKLDAGKSDGFFNLDIDTSPIELAAVIEADEN